MPEFLPHWLLVTCAWVGLINLGSVGLFCAIAFLSDTDQRPGGRFHA